MSTIISQELHCKLEWLNKSMTSVAIIPARGGSKRIPRKNLKFFNGLPVIAYAIKMAKESKIFDEVIVSTDDEEIAETAISFGATVPWMRPKELADDYATTVNVIQDAVKKLRISHADLEDVCCIYPATPLLKSEFILEGHKILLSEDWSYVFSGLKVENNPERFFSLGQQKGVEMLFPRHVTTRTQDLVPMYHDAGQFYWGRASAWELGLPIFSSRSTIIELPSGSVIDIDTQADWYEAERLYAIQMRGIN